MSTSPPLGPHPRRRRQPVHGADRNAHVASKPFNMLNRDSLRHRAAEEDPQQLNALLLLHMQRPLGDMVHVGDAVAEGAGFAHRVVATTVGQHDMGALRQRPGLAPCGFPWPPGEGELAPDFRLLRLQSWGLIDGAIVVQELYKATLLTKTMASTLQVRAAVRDIDE
mgnify:CR=1 FL=1